MHQAMEGRFTRERYRQSGLREVDTFWKRRRGPARIEMCKHDEVYARTRFAVVSILTLDTAHMYTESAVKLGVSLRWWFPREQMDLVMLLTEGFGVDGQIEKMKLARAGWNVLCSVSRITHPGLAPSSGNRLHEAGVYSKLNMWGLLQYEAILFLDSDTLVMRNPTSLFTVHLRGMIRGNFTLGAVRDRPAKESVHFNSGVLLLLPGKGPFGEQVTVNMLQKSIHRLPHDVQLIDQALLNVWWGPDTFYVLPFIFNANVVSKAVEPGLWQRNQDRIVILHFTVSKGWHSFRFIWQNDPISVWTCWWWSTDDLCRLWESVQPPQ